MNDTLTIALPKGRLAEQTLDILASSGYANEVEADSRQLIYTDTVNRITYLFVKPVDVVTYVKEGVCDLGIAGKDTIAEEDADIYELFDLGIGACYFAVAGPTDLDFRSLTTLRIATKYPKVATDYFQSSAQDLQIIKLNGSVELAPLIGLSDVIVDIVETGSTLRANNLAVLERMQPITARIIANKASYRRHYDAINQLIDRLNRRDTND